MKTSIFKILGIAFLMGVILSLSISAAFAAYTQGTTTTYGPILGYTY